MSLVLKFTGVRSTTSTACGAAAADGVIHLARNHNFAEYEAAGQTDRHAIEALGGALAGSDRRLVVTAGLAGFNLGRPVTEDDSAATSPRMSEVAALALAAQGARASAVRLAPSVHDHGDHGFVPTLIDIARQTGVAAYVGEGLNRWPAVYQLYAARLFRLALEQGTAGARYHGAADEHIPMRDIAILIGWHPEPTRRLQSP